MRIWVREAHRAAAGERHCVFRLCFVPVGASSTALRTAEHRPQGSRPTLVKIYTDSGAPVNLKNRVCSRMTAAVTRTSQLAIFWGVVNEVIAVVE